MCSICIVNDMSLETIQCCYCSSEFHKKCLKSWYDYQYVKQCATMTCPNCRINHLGHQCEHRELFDDIQQHVQIRIDAPVVNFMSRYGGGGVPNFASRYNDEDSNRIHTFMVMYLCILFTLIAIGIFFRNIN